MRGGNELDLARARARLVFTQVLNSLCCSGRGCADSEVSSTNFAHVYHAGSDARWSLLVLRGTGCGEPFVHTYNVYI